jgi:error-prone DNA polymerase
MGFHNPPVPWSEFERRLDGRAPNHPVDGDGGDSPAWSRKRTPYQPVLTRRAGAVPYAELHCHSNFSFLDGASHPEELAEEAARLGLEALALTDHDGMYGVVRFAEAAKAVGLPTVFGAELSLSLTRPQNGVADPEGAHLLVLARNPDGYARLCRAISTAQLAGGEKGKPVYDLAALAEAHGGQWQVLTGCRKGPPPELLLEAFGREHVAVELWDHGTPHDTARNDRLAAFAATHRLPTVATNNVHYATPERHRLATVLAAVRARRSLDEIDGWLPAGPTAHLRSGAEQAGRFARWPGAVARAAEIGRACAFDLSLVAPKLPPCPVPDGHTEATWLRHLTMEGFARKYSNSRYREQASLQIEKELALIELLDFPGYFLIVHDIVQFCKSQKILCQGRGSAANSAVCYVLGITSVDSVELNLLFERFLSPYRDGPPDIDLDIESDRREVVIQHVYSQYGRTHAAQVANVITYRPRSAVRDVGRAFGYAMGQLDRWSKQIEHCGPLSSAASEAAIPPTVVEMTNELLGFPRHLGIHSGGMVLCDRPVIDVCPVEWARRENRSVLQWDKDDCAAAGLVKFDLLGLGMLSALHDAFDLVEETTGVHLELDLLPKEDPAVYDMLCRADSVGVFQVESRAQMATLPRLRPRRFSDLVIEIAIIRPGPIQGGSVHPYIRRRHGLEKWEHLHPLLAPALEKTLGVPLFQEQLMQIAIDVAGFTPAEADELRMAMGSKRSHERMAQLHDRLCTGMVARGVPLGIAEQIYDKLIAFANFGFPESHAVSFAYLVYASSWLKLRHPAAFLAALLNAQPMGFYSPQSLVADAQRHDVVVLGPDVNASRAKAHVDGSGAVRLGLSSVRSVSEEVAERIVAQAPYASMIDVVHRADLTGTQTESLATAGAFGAFGLDRRGALWAAGPVAQTGSDRLDGITSDPDAPPLPSLTEVEQTVADLWALGLSPDRHLVAHSRDRLTELGAVTAAGLRAVPNGTRVLVAGAVIHRQRPATAGGVTFVNLEDETGHINVICSKGVWLRYRQVARTSAGLLIRGRVENVEGVINIEADRIGPLTLAAPHRSRDFH